MTRVSRCSDSTREPGCPTTWMLELSSNILSHVTTDAAGASDAVWFPDSRGVAFARLRSGVRNLYRKDAGASVEAALPESATGLNYAEDVSRDERFLLYRRSQILCALSLSGDRKPVALTDSAFAKGDARCWATPTMGWERLRTTWTVNGTANPPSRPALAGPAIAPPRQIRDVCVSHVYLTWMTEDVPRIVRTPIPFSEVIASAQRRFGDMVKAAVDVGRGVMALGGELHSDEEALLLELFDLTANDPRWRGHRRREVLRAREQFCRVFFDEGVEAGLADYLRKYFLQFAVAARRQ